MFCFHLLLSESECENCLQVFMWGKKVLLLNFSVKKKVLIWSFQWRRKFFKTLNGEKVMFFGEGQGFFESQQGGRSVHLHDFFQCLKWEGDFSPLTYC